MARIVEHSGAEDLLDGKVNPALWTALIPAAGRGTRLGFDKPKILFPVGGSTILERLTGLLAPFCAQFVFVLSPEGAPVVEPEIQKLLRERGGTAIQENPLGMGDAVDCGLAYVRTRNVAIVWGDQCALRPSSVEFCMRLLQGAARPSAVCPTVVRQRPYIHFERDTSGVITRVLQQREGDALPSEGESDSGVFFFRTDALKGYMADLFRNEGTIGRLTGELNFLPVLPLVDAKPGQLITARIMTEEESVGVNSRQDALYLAEKGSV